MHDAVAKRRRRDDPFFRAVDLEGNIAPWPIIAASELPFQSEKLALQIGKERSRAGFPALASGRPVGSHIQRLEIGDAAE
jgi:hypothetical protein